MDTRNLPSDWTSLRLRHKTLDLTYVQIAEFVQKITNRVPAIIRLSGIKCDIQFYTVKDTHHCLERLHGAQLRDKLVTCRPHPIRALWGERTRWVRIGDLEPDLTRKQIAAHIQQETGIRIDERAIYLQRNDRCKERNTRQRHIEADIECRNHGEAMKVREALNLKAIEGGNEKERERLNWRPINPGCKVWCQLSLNYKGQFPILELSNMRRSVDRGLLEAHITREVMVSGRFNLKFKPPKNFGMNAKNRAVMAFELQEEADRVGEILNGSKMYGGWEISVRWVEKGVNVDDVRKYDAMKKRFRDAPTTRVFGEKLFAQGRQRGMQKMEGKTFGEKLSNARSTPSKGKQVDFNLDEFFNLKEEKKVKVKLVDKITSKSTEKATPVWGSGKMKARRLSREAKVKRAQMRKKGNVKKE